jgi:hypothetical protein
MSLIFFRGLLDRFVLKSKLNRIKDKRDWKQNGWMKIWPGDGARQHEKIDFVF